MNVNPTFPGFTTTLSKGNPLPQTVFVSQTRDAAWTVLNVFNTPWLKVNLTSGSGDGIFSVSVNIYDPSVVPGGQTGILLIDSINPTITMQVTLTLNPN
jgi:hypothetical protein